MNNIEIQNSNNIIEIKIDSDKKIMIKKDSLHFAKCNLFE